MRVINLQLPAYEFDFSDVNPPVHAMAVLHAHQQQSDAAFLLRCFNKLALNFNWSVRLCRVATGCTCVSAQKVATAENFACLVMFDIF